MAWLEDSIEEFKKLKTPAKVAVVGGIAAAGLIGYSYVRNHQASGGQGNSSGAAAVTDPFGALTGSGGALGNNATGTSDAGILASIMAMLTAINANVSGARTDAAASNNTLNNIWKRTYGNTGGTDKHGPPIKVHPIEKVVHH